MTGITKVTATPPTAAERAPTMTFRCVACERAVPIIHVVFAADPNQRPFDLVRCESCGLVQQWPRYGSRELAALYDDRYYVFGEDEPARWARAVQQYAVHVLPWERPQYRRLLEVGSAMGHFSALAARRGWRVVGLDLSAEAVSEASARFGLDFRAGPLRRHRDTLPPFDLIFLGDVLEHVPSPVELLRDVRQLLAPDGVVCIDTPNFGSWWRRLGGRRWLGLNRYHINLFDAGTLGRLLADCGYTDIRLAAYTHYRHESWSVRPELQRWVGLLPKAVAWRVNRFLERRSRRSPWQALRDAPPATPEAAQTLLAQLAAAAAAGLRPGRDNLLAAARRPASG